MKGSIVKCQTVGKLWNLLQSEVELSSVPWAMGSCGGGHDRWSSRDPFPIFSAGGHFELLWHGQGCSLFDFVQPAFPLPTTVSLTLQGVLEDGSGEAVMAYDTPELCEHPSLDSCQKWFLWTHKGVDLVLRPVVGLVRQAGDSRKSFLRLLLLSAWILFSGSASRVHFSQQ